MHEALSVHFSNFYRGNEPNVPDRDPVAFVKLPRFATAASDWRLIHVTHRAPFSRRFGDNFTRVVIALVLTCGNHF